jgi:ribonuclease-3
VARDRGGDGPKALDRILGVRFRDASLRRLALTHRSYAFENDLTANNERLEFLGDAVIDLLVSEYLMTHFPLAREGDLSKLRAAVVDEPGLAGIGRALQIGELLRLGRGEELTGGRDKASLVADAMEAVIAAVFLDGGLAAVHRLIDPFLEEAYARAVNGSIDRDFKTQLQEQAQARYRSSPRYRVVAEVGPDHSKTFEIEVELRGEALGRGSGRSKKDAEQAAARLAVEALAALPLESAPAPGVPEAARPPQPPPEPPPVVEPAAKAPPARKARKAKVRKSPASKAPRKAKAGQTRKIAARRVRD